MWNIIKFLDFTGEGNINNVIENKNYSIPIIFCLIFIIFTLIFLLYYKITQIEKDKKDN